MGGMGFIERFRVECLRSILVNTHLIEASYRAGVQRYFFSSSACAYNTDLQKDPRTCARSRSPTPTRPWPSAATAGRSSSARCSARSTGRSAAWRPTSPASTTSMAPTAPGSAVVRRRPAAMCRKVIEAKDSGDLRIEIWGDGSQTRSFCYIDDCVHGIDLIMHCAGAHRHAHQPRLQRAGVDQRAGVASWRTSPA